VILRPPLWLQSRSQWFRVNIRLVSSVLRDGNALKLEGKRPGFDDEWIVTAKTDGERLKSGEVSSISPFFPQNLATFTNPLGLLAVAAFSGKNVSTELNLLESRNITFNVRMTLRSFPDALLTRVPPIGWEHINHQPDWGLHQEHQPPRPSRLI
jgi:hypothetical protein